MFQGGDAIRGMFATCIKVEIYTGTLCFYNSNNTSAAMCIYGMKGHLS